MALQISKETPLGIPAEYWRIISARIDFGANTMAVSVAGYINKQARDDGKAPIIQEQINFVAEEFVPDQPRQGVYEAMKLMADWAEAVDV